MRRIVSGSIVVGLVAAAGWAGTAVGHTTPDTGSVERLSVFIRDTSQLSANLNRKGNHGDLFSYHGAVFTKKGGKQIGRFGGTCTTLGAKGGLPEDQSCFVDYRLAGGTLFTQVYDTTARIFGGKTFSFAVLGGTGAYRNARGEGTFRVPVDVKDQTDGFVTFAITR
ncbi:MAG: allene oxide cyclase barrel-like domain-containing protein [Sporichthyaceae bacterium]